MSTRFVAVFPRGLLTALPETRPFPLSVYLYLYPCIQFDPSRTTGVLFRALRSTLVPDHHCVCSLSRNTRSPAIVCTSSVPRFRM